MNTLFSAGPQALGYLYQARYALFALLADQRQEACVVIEGLDDVVVSGDERLTLDQLKHHVTEVATLTDFSPELWKTIRVWSESLKRGDWKPEEVNLNLITTGQAEAGSAAALLKSGSQRDTKAALTLLLKASEDSTNQKLVTSYNAFKALRTIQQERLLEAITIMDSTANIQNIPHLTKRILHYSVDSEYIDSLHERLEGWWFDKVVTHLMGKSQQPIFQSELQSKIISIADQFKKESLPIDYYYEEPSNEYFINNDNRVFVQQLKHLKLNTKRIRNAVLDYYRAFEQRSRWVRENLFIDDEVMFYELRLKQEWERYMAVLEDEFSDLEIDANCVSFGRRALSWMESVQLPIRSKMPVGHEYVTRGSYHILADALPPQVYWHPKFIESLDQILAL